MPKVVPTIKNIITKYNEVVGNVEQNAISDTSRAYGGVVRANKGKLVEDIAKSIVAIAWQRINGSAKRLSFDNKKTRIDMNIEYVNTIKDNKVREWLKNNYKEQYYLLKTDIHVLIDKKFVIGVECKSYTENAMLKRILVDFSLLKTKYPELNCVLLQLESQLTGDYSEISKTVICGSKTTHTIMSYFEIDLMIITLLEGERKVKEAIHKKGYFKELTELSLERAIDKFRTLLERYK